LDAPDRPCPKNRERIADADLGRLDPVECTRKRVGRGREIGRERRWERVEVAEADRRDGGILRERSGIGVVAVELLFGAEILPAVEAEATFAAIEDGAEEDPVARLDALR
jgi:hypothetical protein